MVRYPSSTLNDDDFNQLTYQGYNLITGETYNNFNAEVHKGRRIVGDGLSSYTMKQGKNTLRESAARYHAPIGSGPQFEYRQNVLMNEGVFAERSIIIHCVFLY